MRLIDADALKRRVLEVYPSAADNESILQIIDGMDEALASNDFGRQELLASDFNSLSQKDKERYTRANAIPDVVVNLCVAERLRLRKEVVEREITIDNLSDFLNGYDMTPEIPF